MQTPALGRLEEKMLGFTKYKKKAKDIKQLVTGYGACYASTFITKKGQNVNYFYREESDFSEDSGWRFLSGKETQEDIDNPKTIEIYDVNTIANYSKDIIPFLDYEKGFAFERNQENGNFYCLQNECKTQLNLTYAFSQLRKRNEKVPNPLWLPTEKEIDNFEEEYKIKFPKDYKSYLLTASDVILGCLEPGQIIDKKDENTYLGNILKIYESFGLNSEYIPICNDNDSFYCIDKDSKIHLIDSDLNNDSIVYEDLADWILNCWIRNCI